MRITIPLVLFVLCFLSACAQRVSSIKKDVDIPLENEMGYMLLGVETNLSLDSIFIGGEKSVRLTREDLRSGTKFFLIDMPAGDYYFHKIKLNYWWRFNLDEDYWKFSVSPGVISYIGHMEVDTYGFWPIRSKLELENRSSEALEFMEQEFPNILKSRTLTYDGPGEDLFFEKINTLIQEGAAE